MHPKEDLFGANPHHKEPKSPTDENWSAKNQPAVKPDLYDHVYHNPTYCFVSKRDENGQLPTYTRHLLSHFSRKNDVQSKNSMNKFKNAISWMLLFADKKKVFSKKEQKTFSFRLAFITLTLPSAQSHMDKFIKEHLLQPFLYWISRYYTASYVWKAESQLNGNIHFHITIDTFIPWKSIRSKWNQICAKHGYCKVFQDGSNDKGDAATQIKAIRNENDLNKTVGGYLTKGSIEEKNHFALKKKEITLENIIEKFPYISCNLETRQHYSRFIEGRLWGCSESLSKIKCFTSQLDNDFNNTEYQFFHDNKLQQLSTVMVNSAKKKLKGVSDETRRVMQTTDEDLQRKYNPFESVYIHRHLKFCKIPEPLKNLIATEKASRKFATQKSFTVESLS